MLGVELIIMIVATFGLSISGTGFGLDIIGLTIFWRGILGLGVGGDYPSSAIIIAELAPVKSRGAMMATVFAGQGLGQFTASLVSFVLTEIYKDALINNDPVTGAPCGPTACQPALDRSWRIFYAIGIVPAVV